MAEQVFTGTLKLVGGTAMANIQCQETFAKYQRDVRVDVASVPTALNNDIVHFTVKEDRFGVPEAIVRSAAAASAPVVTASAPPAAVASAPVVTASAPPAAAKSEAPAAAAGGLDISIAGLNGVFGKAEGRDKFARVFQYGSRMIVGLVELAAPAKGSALMELGDRAGAVQKTLGGARRTHRWGKEIPVIQALPKTFRLLTTSPLDAVLEITAKLNQLGYLFWDHLAWLKQQGLFKQGRSDKEAVKMAMTFFTYCNAASMVIQLKKSNEEKDSGKRSEALTQAFKHFLLVIQCAHNAAIFETHNFVVGATGVVSSLIDLKKQWPVQKAKK